MTATPESNDPPKDPPRCCIVQCDHRCSTLYPLDEDRYVCDDCCRELGRLMEKMAAERN